ncbi:hypothetical protein AKJ09_00147 [Labilithrix luteola]|uniref:DUF2760 domain-containing protein n=1 Tax=Labilithrix luteola TaxID=1391654 RepID=A0A0K1PIW3_9BACT|nr:hypothetical protein AKJ09_00147 [Labilithrix luteola]
MCFFRVLFDGVYAAQLQAGKALPAATQGPERTPELPATPEPKVLPKPEPKPIPEPPKTDAALQLLALLQREGRLVDFLEEDVASFPDADIGAAARVVHAGCRKALREHVKLEAVRSEEEGVRVTLPEGFDAEAVKLTGNVQGKGPYTGTLRHRGWRVASVSLPTAVGAHDVRIVAQAEVEL